MPKPLLSVRGLTVSFRTERGLVQAVHGVSFDVMPGEVVGVVGESGSGKSISLLSVLGLVTDPNARVGGSIVFKGQELRGARPRVLRDLRGREIAMIFQDPMTALTPVHSIGWQIVEQIRAHRPLSATAAKRRAIDLLAEVGIANPESQFDRFPHQFSGGMRQRAMIAMALSCDPALLIADEPTTALDVTVQAQILDLIRKLRRDHGSAVVLITHDMGVIAELADRVIVMYAGHVAEQGAVRDLFADPWHPYTWGLLASIPPLDGPRPRRLASIPGAPPSPFDMPPGCPFAPRCAYRFDACDALPPKLPPGAHAAACLLADADRERARRSSLDVDA